MIIGEDLITGSFVRRDNRFKATVLVHGKNAFAHVPNSGRMQELLTSGSEVALAPAKTENRLTSYDLVQVKHKGIWVSTDSRMPNRLLADAFVRGLIPEFRSYESYRLEPAFGSGRFDLALKGSEGECLVEAKSVNLVENGVALFPDAPTTRGARHLRELAQYVRDGGKGYVFFIIQRDDAKVFSPFAERDPDFALACGEAAEAGVNLIANKCRTAFGSIALSERLEIKL